MAAVFASTPHYLPHRLPSPFRRRYLHPSPLHSPPAPPSPSAAVTTACEWPIEQRIQESLAILDLMESQSMPPDASLLCSILKSCTEARSLPLGRAVHEKALRAGLHTDPFVANNLLLLYSRCGLLSAARQIFDEMPARNVVSWTTAISMYQQAGVPRDALHLYSLMCADAAVMPNAFTYTAVLSCCATTKDFELGSRVHEQIVTDGFQNDKFVIVALIDMYTKCGELSHGRQVFDQITDPSIEACTAMIEGYSGNGLPKEAADVIRMLLRSRPIPEVATGLGITAMIRPSIMEMSLRGGQEMHAHIIKFGHKAGDKPLSALVNLYEKCDKMMIAYRVFSELEVKEIRLWRRLLVGFVRNGLYVKALKVYEEMSSLDYGLSLVVVLEALKACVGMKSLKEGKQIHGILIKVENLIGSVLLSGLAEMYNSCGEHGEALKVKLAVGNEMGRTGSRDQLTQLRVKFMDDSNRLVQRRLERNR